MALENCIPKIKEMYSNSISENEAIEIVQTIDAIRSNHADPKLFRDAVRAYIESTGFKLTKEAKTQLLSISAEIDLTRRALDPSFNGDAKQGIISVLEESTTKGKFTGLSAESAIKDAEARYLTAPIAHLRSQGLLPAFISGQFDKDIIKVLWTGIKNEGPSSKIINGIADLYRHVLDTVHSETTDIGLNVGYIKNYVPQSHDSRSIVEAGFDDWSKAIMMKVDNIKTFPEINVQSFISAIDQIAAGKLPSEIKGNAWIDRLQEMFDDLSKKNSVEQHSDFSEILDRVVEGTTKKVQKSRSIHFKNAEAFLEYNDLFGRNKTFQEMMGGYLTKMSREVGMVKVLGPTPKATLEGTLKNMYETGALKGVDLDAARKDILQSFNIVSGNFYKDAGEKMVTKIGKNTRQLIGFSQLGMSGITQLLDLPTTMFNVWARTGDVVKATWKAPLDYITSVPAAAGLSRDARTQALLAFSDSITDETKRFLVGNTESRVQGGLTKALDMYLTLHGMKFMNRVSTLANIKLISASIIKGGYNEIQLKDAARFGLSEADLKLSGKLLDEVNGVVQDLVFLDDSKFTNELGKAATISRLQQYMYSFVTSGSPKPGAFERRLFSGGFTPGTYKYEALQAIAQYKSIAMKQFRGMYLAASLRGGISPANITKIVGASAAFGITGAALNLILKEYIKNGYNLDKAFEEFENNGGVGKSIARSQLASVFGEMVINSRGDLIDDASELATQIMGPIPTTVGNVGIKTIHDTWGSVKEGDLDYRKTVKALGRMTPGRNSPLRYIPAINQAVDEAYDDMLDLAK